MEHDYRPELSKKALRHFERVKELIKYCHNDQPWDHGEVNWLLGEKMELRDLLENNDVPYEYWEEIAPYMVCQGCGTDAFTIYDDICIDDKYDRKILSKIVEGERKYKKQIDELLKYAANYPSLILQNPLAKRIFNEIASKELPSWQNSEFICYRSRTIKDDKVFSIEDMNAPGEGIAGIGRYNHAGKSTFYVSNSQDCAVSEIVKDPSVQSKAWVQKYKVQDIGNILDLTMDWNEFYNLKSVLFVTLLNRRVFEQKGGVAYSTWKPEYLLTNFLSDCAKNAGYKGIRYTSVKGYDFNVVFFDSSKLNIKPQGTPELVTVRAEPKRTVVDF